MLEKLALPEVRELIAESDLITLREVLNRWLPVDIADLLKDLSSKEDIVAFQCLAPVLAARTFEYLPLVAQKDRSCSQSRSRQRKPERRLRD